MSSIVAGQPAFPAPAPGPHVRFGDLLQDGVELLRRHFLALTIPFVVLAVITGAGQAGDDARFDASDLTASPQDLLVFVPFFVMLGALALAIGVILFFAYSLVCVATSRAALDAAAGATPRAIGDQLRAAWPQLFPAAGAFALGLLFVILGFVALVVPGFIVIAALFPLSAVIAAEKLRGMAAIRRAWAITRGHRWALFGIFILTGLAIGIAAAAISWLPIVGGALGSIVSGIGSAYLAAVGALYYHRIVPQAAAPPLSVAAP